MKTRNTWRFDYTVQWISSKRLPSLIDNVGITQPSVGAPSFFLMNAQVSKTWKERFEIYVGGENLG